MVVIEVIILKRLGLVRKIMSFYFCDHLVYRINVNYVLLDYLDCDVMVQVFQLLVYFVILVNVYLMKVNATIILIVIVKRKNWFYYLVNFFFVIKVYVVINSYYDVLSIFIFYCKGFKMVIGIVIFINHCIVYDWDQVKVVVVVFCMYDLFIILVGNGVVFIDFDFES